jgi:hypothetical protein
MPNPLDPKHLREVAEAASGEPWTVEFVFTESEREDHERRHLTQPWDFCTDQTCTQEHSPYWNDASEWAYSGEPFKIEGPAMVENGEFNYFAKESAQHIAAFDPPTVLALLDVLDAALEQVELDEHISSVDSYSVVPISDDLEDALAPFRASDEGANLEVVNLTTCVEVGCTPGDHHCGKSNA